MIQDSQYFKTIDAQFPKLGKAIALFWGHKEFTDLMHDLQHNAYTDKPRAGFPADVLFAIHELENDHNAIYPHLARQDRNIWTMSLR